MNLIQAAHQLAMDTNTLAELSKAKGLEEDAKNFYISAYELERKAAMMTSPSSSSIFQMKVRQHLKMRNVACNSSLTNIDYIYFKNCQIQREILHFWF